MNDSIHTNTILKFQSEELGGINFDSTQLEQCISESEELLESLGLGDKVKKCKSESEQNNTPWTSTIGMIIPDWKTLCDRANSKIKNPIESISNLFSPEELEENRLAIKNLNRDFNDLYKLDSVDITISALAGIKYTAKQGNGGNASKGRQHSFYVIEKHCQQVLKKALIINSFTAYIVKQSFLQATVTQPFQILHVVFQRA